MPETSFAKHAKNEKEVCLFKAFLLCFSAGKAYKSIFKIRQSLHLDLQSERHNTKGKRDGEGEGGKQTQVPVLKSYSSDNNW